MRNLTDLTHGVTCCADILINSRAELNLIHLEAWDSVHYSPFEPWLVETIKTKQINKHTK